MSRRSDLAMRPATYDTVLRATGLVRGELIAIIIREIELADRARQALEDKRSIKRNVNRLFTLIGALLISIVVTYVTQAGIGGHLVRAAGPYAFCITLALDSGFLAWAIRRRY